MVVNKRKTLFDYIEIVCAVVLLLVLLCHVFILSDANIFHYTCHMESDIASETLVATRIFENGFVQPKTWVTSTHDWIIMTPNLAAFIYPLVGNDMNLSMGIACSITMVILVVLMFLFYKQIGFSYLENFLAILLVFILARPADENQRMLFLYAAYYVSHFASLFILLMLYNICLKKDKVPVLFFILTLALSVVNSLQGMHACLFCYMPLLGTELLRRIVAMMKKKKPGNVMILVWLFVISAVALLGSKLIGSYTPGASRNIRHAGEKFTEVVWPNIKAVLDFDRVPVLVALFLIIAIVGYVITFFGKLVKSGETKPTTAYESVSGDYLLWSTLPLLFGFVVCALSEIFTTAESAPRYYLNLLFIVGTGMALFIHYFNKKWIALLAIPVIYYGVIAGQEFYNNLVVCDASEDQATYHVTQWMEENGYEYGYATFDHANYITVMSNNSVKVRGVNNMADMEGIKWLSDKTWYPPYKSTEGATCYIFTDYLQEDFAAFMERVQPTVLETTMVDNYNIVVLDHDYTIWVD